MCGVKTPKVMLFYAKTLVRVSEVKINLAAGIVVAESSKSTTMTPLAGADSHLLITHDDQNHWQTLHDELKWIFQREHRAGFVS
jgi:hypothetical protein